MAGKKNLDFTQFGRVLASLASAVISPDNDGREVSVTPQGALWVKIDGSAPSSGGYAAKNYVSFEALVSEGLLATGAWDLLEFYGFREGSEKRYIHIFDDTSRPANGSAPKVVVPLFGTDTIFSNSNPPVPVANMMFTDGIYFAVSSTLATLTYDSDTGIWVNAMVARI